MSVPVGPTTVAGYGVTAAAFLAAVLAFVAGDHSEQTLGTIVAGALCGVAFLVTQLGRYHQAVAQVHALGATVDELDPGIVDVDDDELPADPIPPAAAALTPTDPTAVPRDEGDAGPQGAA